MRIIGVLLVIWFAIGAIAAWQRGDFKSAKANCSSAGTIAVTVLAGPLNYAGANPKTHCHVPRPSK